jgi:flagellar basal body rod protein FlgF
VSALGDALAALKKVVLIEENVSRLQSDMSLLTDEVRRNRDYTASVDRRVAVLEGMIQGFNMASAARRLPEE